MPKIKLIQSQRTLPQSGGNAFLQDRSGAIIGGAVEQLGDNLRVIEERTSAKKAKVATFEAKNELLGMSRLDYTDAIDQKRGANALPNEETGQLGVYGDYDKKAGDFITERVGRIDPRYQDDARASLEGVAERYRDRFMGYQAQQQNEHRKSVLHNNITLMEDELKMSMASGGSLEDIDFVFKDIAAMTKEEARGGNVTEFLDAKKAALYEGAITASITDYPEQALEMLNNSKTIKTLDPATRKNLTAAAEKQLVMKSANQTINQITGSGLTEDGQLEMVDELPTKTPEQREVRDVVSREVNYQIAQDAKIESTKQSNLISETYDAIFDEGVNISPAAIDSDPLYSILEPNHKLMIKSWLGGGKAGQYAETERALLWDDARIKVITGEWDEKDLRDNLGTAYDVRDFKGLVNLTIKEKTNPMTSGLVDELFQAFHEKQFANKKSRAKIDQGVFMDIQEYKRVNKTFPGREAVKKMLDDNAVGYVEKQWFDSQFVDRMEDAFPTIDEPQYKYIDDDSGKRLSFTDREVFRYRDERGFPSAMYLSTDNVFLLGAKAEPDGKFWWAIGDTMYSLPDDDPRVKDMQALLNK